jgi:hypothetical protein
MLDPVDDADVNVGSAWPVLGRDRVNYCAAMCYEVVEARAPRTVLRDRVCADKPSALAVAEVVVGLTKPVDAVVLDPAVEGRAKPLEIFGPKQLPEVAIAVKWRVADDDASRWPRNPQGVGCLDPAEVLERQCGLGRSSSSTASL